MVTMSIHEIVLPETKPETEWILGRAVQKTGGTTTHAVLQGAFSIVLAEWARGRGEVGISWRFRVAPPGEIRRPLAPDVAYVSIERLRPLKGFDSECPPFAPDVPVEILSPDEPLEHIEHKTDVYLAAGSSLVIIVDPAKRSMCVHDANGVHELGGHDVLSHAALPGFSLPLEPYFAKVDRRR
jgi:Uma2 family endonuclease